MGTAPLGIRRWLFLAAMEEEERAILDRLGALRCHEWTASDRGRVKGLRFQLPEGQLTVVRTGVGVVNAALALALACEHGRPDAVLLLGVGGALSPELSIGDLVVSRSVFQHDSLSTLDSGDFRKRSGEIVLSDRDARRARPHCAADRRLHDWIRAEFPRARSGTLISGNEFVGRVKRKRELAELAPDALLVDMEGAGVALVADRYGIPFVAAKTVADRLAPDGRAIESDFALCLESSAAHAAEVAARAAGV
jgi:adenosylhomocysteine nucleosidase